MIDGGGNPLSPLLLHNALAVVLAAFLAQALRYRALAAAMSTGLALVFTLTWPSINHLYEFAWGRFVCLPLWYARTALSNGALWPQPTMMEVDAATMLCLSPFALAYFAAWQWAPSRRRSGSDITGRQVRLRTVLLTLTLCSFLLGVADWIDNGRMLAYPLAAVASLLLLRPIRWWRQVKARRRHDHRLALLLGRIRWSCGRTESGCEPAAIQWRPSDLLSQPWRPRSRNP